MAYIIILPRKHNIILYTATHLIHNVTWRRVNNTTLEFTCEVACRTPFIVGCAVNLVSNSDTISNLSSNIIGMDEAISSRFVIVLVNDVDSTAEYNFTVTPTVIENGISILIAVSSLIGTIPTALQCKYNYVCISTYIYLVRVNSYL